MDEEGWQTISRKGRRQRSWQSQMGSDAFGGRPGGTTAQRSGHRLLPLWLRRDYQPPTPPWRAGGAGERGDNSEQASVPWPFKGTTRPAKDEKILCCNPNCPGLGGKPSFKYLYRAGQGQYGFQRMACHTPWEKSWEAHFNGRPPATRGPQKGGQHKGDDPGKCTHRTGQDPSTGSPAWNVLDNMYKGLLEKIVALPDEAAREEAMAIFKDTDDNGVGKAMVAAYTEVMATRQATERPLLRHPAVDVAGDMSALQKSRNKAENNVRQSKALVHKTKMAVLDLQEEYKNRLAKAQKEAADAVDQNEQCLQDLALLDQQIAAAVAERERKLLHEAAAPAGPSDPLAQPLRRHCQNDVEAMELQQVLGMFVDRLMEANSGKLSGVVGKLKEVLSTIEAPAQPQQTAQERAGPVAPHTPPVSEQALPGGPGVVPPCARA